MSFDCKYPCDVAKYLLPIMQTAFYWFSPLAMQVAACICCPKGALWFGECL